MDGVWAHSFSLYTCFSHFQARKREEPCFGREKGRWSCEGEQRVQGNAPAETPLFSSPSPASLPIKSPHISDFPRPILRGLLFHPNLSTIPGILHRNPLLKVAPVPIVLSLSSLLILLARVGESSIGLDRSAYSLFRSVSSVRYPQGWITRGGFPLVRLLGGDCALFPW